MARLQGRFAVLDNMSLQLFHFQDQQQDIRVTAIDGDLWFVASDVCKILDHSNVSVAISRLDEDEKGISNVYTLGGNQSLLCVNESGLYHLIFTSRKEEAKIFRRWITDEVLPSIRKTGSYSADGIGNSEVIHPPIQPLQAKDLQQIISSPTELFPG